MWIINDASREYLDPEVRRAKRLAETKEVLAELEAGDPIEGEEVLAWLDRWSAPDENEAERKPPRCSPAAGPAI